MKTVAVVDDGQQEEMSVSRVSQDQLVVLDPNRHSEELAAREMSDKTHQD